jgi:RNA polymerase sigma-70 factor (ECF subfamily)
MSDAVDPNGARLLEWSELQQASDNELAQELVGGNHEALAILIDRYQRLVFTIAFRIVHDKGEAEDLVQDIFLLLFRKVKLFDPSKGIFKVWFLRCAYTSSMNRRDHLERGRFYTTVELDEAGPLAVPGADLFAGSLTEREATRFARQSLDTLKPNQRKAIDLIALEGMSLEEAAHTMGYSVAATRNYYYRGMMALRAFNTNLIRSSVRQSMPALVVGNGNGEVAHLKARPA